MFGRAGRLARQLFPRASYCMRLLECTQGMHTGRVCADDATQPGVAAPDFFGTYACLGRQTNASSG